ncbi:MAG: YceI family protein [Alphaproteobacteria bacterium]|jgi:polyisoprenoid-binding protein YceI|nr:YceI family protein [Alphaproteobacteria bacterium]
MKKLGFFLSTLLLLAATGIALAAQAGRYYIPPQYFDAGIQLVKKDKKSEAAVFQNATAAFLHDPNTNTLTGLKIAIDTNSIEAARTDTAMNFRSLLETMTYPELTFVETAPTKFEGDKAKVKGRLSIKGHDQDIILDAVKESGTDGTTYDSTPLTIKLTGSVPYSESGILGEVDADETALKFVFKLRAIKQ